MADWSKTGPDRWQATAGDAVLSVTRKVVKRTRTHRSRFGFGSYRTSTSTTIAWAYVRRGSEVVDLGCAGHNGVRGAQAAAERFAATGEGRVLARSILED